MAHPSGSLEPSEPTSTGPPQGEKTTNCLHTWMVCCWHTWTSNTWSSGMPQTRNCRAQLCCRSAAEEDDTAEDPYNWTPTDVWWPWHAADTQLKRGPHQCIPWSLWRHQMLPRYLPHHPSRGCLTSCPCSMKVPYCNVAPGAWEAGWMGEVRTSLPQLKNWWTGYHLFAYSMKPNGRDYDSAWTPRTWMMQLRGTTTKNPNCGRNHPPVSGQYKVHEGWMGLHHTCVLFWTMSDHSSWHLTHCGDGTGFVRLPFGLTCS